MNRIHVAANDVGNTADSFERLEEYNKAADGGKQVS